MLPPTIRALVNILLSEFSGNRTAAANYAERIARMNGIDASEYAAAARLLRTLNTTMTDTPTPRRP